MVPKLVVAVARPSMVSRPFIHPIGKWATLTINSCGRNRRKNYSYGPLDGHRWLVRISDHRSPYPRPCLPGLR